MANAASSRSEDFALLGTGHARPQLTGRPPADPED
jgi:hypothetical protein